MLITHLLPFLYSLIFIYVYDEKLWYNYWRTNISRMMHPVIIIGDCYVIQELSFAKATKDPLLPSKRSWPNLSPPMWCTIHLFQAPHFPCFSNPPLAPWRLYSWQLPQFTNTSVSETVLTYWCNTTHNLFDLKFKISIWGKL